MADKKLNEVTKVTDMAYVPVIMSDGSIGQIAKADLASVVAELAQVNFGYNSLADLSQGVIGQLKSDLFYNYKGVDNGTDANNCDETGFYVFDSKQHSFSFSNTPKGEGMLAVFGYDLFVFQMFLSYDDSLFFRRKWGTSYGSWIQIH